MGDLGGLSHGASKPGVPGPNSTAPGRSCLGIGVFFALSRDSCRGVGGRDFSATPPVGSISGDMADCRLVAFESFFGAVGIGIVDRFFLFLRRQRKEAIAASMRRPPIPHPTPIPILAPSERPLAAGAGDGVGDAVLDGNGVAGIDGVAVVDDAAPWSGKFNCSQTP